MRPPSGLVSGDDVCMAVQAALEAHLPAWAAFAGIEDTAIRKWLQLADLQARTAEQMPYGCITTPGVTERPTRRREGFEVVWQVDVAIFDRGQDHDETAARTRSWAAAVRGALLRSASDLDGLASSVTWVGERYDQAPQRDASRTLGGCVLSFDITVLDVLPEQLPPDLGGPPIATVRETRSTVTVRPIPQP